MSLTESLKKAAWLACVGFCLAPGHALGQEVDQCNAQINAGTAEDILYYINEPIGIFVELGAGVVVNSEPDGPPDHYLDIPQFTYDLDCTEDGVNETPAVCNDAGNTVAFDEDSVTTDCVDENGAPIVFQTNRVGDRITFTPSPGSYIRNFSEQTCTVNFNVIVTGVSGDNLEKEIIELAGFASTGDFAATCDNGLTAGGESTVRFDLSTVITTFWVTKDFSDDNPLPVDVHLRCNTGLPLEQSFTITDPAVGGQWPGVAFVVRAFEAGTLDCQVYESPVPGGYTPDYQAGVNGGVAGDWYDDEDGCWYEDVVNGGFTCVIGNDADPATFTVYKEWVIEGAVGDEVIEQAFVRIICNNPIAGGYGWGNEFALDGFLVGDGDSLTATVDTTERAAECRAEESIYQSGVESVDDCGPRTIPAGGSSSCTITNSVFFEGIPTLSQYGLALMAMLLMGVGMVGYRRFGG